MTCNSCDRERLLVKNNNSHDRKKRFPIINDDSSARERFSGINNNSHNRKKGLHS